MGHPMDTKANIAIRHLFDRGDDHCAMNNRIRI